MKTLIYSSFAMLILSLCSCSSDAPSPSEPCFEKKILKRFNVSQNTGLPYNGTTPVVRSIGEITFDNTNRYTSTVSFLGNGTYSITPTSNNCHRYLYLGFKTDNGVSYTYSTMAETARLYEGSWFFDGFVMVNKNNYLDTLALGSKTVN